jgi:MULE transposase domain
MHVIIGQPYPFSRYRNEYLDEITRNYIMLQYAEIIMTDDSAAEKSALRFVWPNSRQLLCHFHIAQAEWRWLISSASGVGRDERKVLMKCFQNVTYFILEVLVFIL